MHIKNILLTGKPGCGKTTLIKQIIEELGLDAGGFYTLEIRREGKREGFKIITLDGKEGLLAHVNIRSPYRVSKYGVDIKNLEEIGVKSILDALEKNKVIVIDEIGKMELFSEQFRNAVLAALDSQSKVLATIMLAANPFADEIKKRQDVKLFYLTPENRKKVKEEIKAIFQQSL
ncbi:MAG: AAA family ATPase [Thermoplasmata archaeon]|nr:MAG: AAA family ATPase [Thermoplasmata archaeon]